MLVVEEQTDEIMVGGKLAWRNGCKPVMPREVISWAANSWLAMLVGPYCSNLPLK